MMHYFEIFLSCIPWFLVGAAATHLYSGIVDCQNDIGILEVRAGKAEFEVDSQGAAFAAIFEIEAVYCEYLSSNEADKVKELKKLFNMIENYCRAHNNEEFCRSGTEGLGNALAYWLPKIEPYGNMATAIDLETGERAQFPQIARFCKLENIPLDTWQPTLAPASWPTTDTQEKK